MTKTCSECKKQKKLGEFYVLGRLSEKYRGVCKECVSRYVASPEYRQEAAKKNHLKRKENGGYKKYYEENKEDISQRNKEYYRNNKGACLERARKWRRKNPDKVNGYWVKREALKLGQLHPDHDPKKEEELRKLCGELELLTGEPYEIDHILPLSQGGFHHHNNLQVLPESWNREKGASLEWRREPAKHWSELPDWLKSGTSV